MAVLTVHVTHHPHHSVMSLRGELDITSVARVRSAVDDVLESGRRRLVVDTAPLTFCDSHGLFGLLDAQRAMDAAGGTMELVHVHGILRRVLDLTGLARAFTIKASPRANARRVEGFRRSIRITPWT